MPGLRTVVVSALVAAVAIRVSAAQPVGGAYARIASDPSAALRGAADGWSVSGTLGDATAQGLREVPLAAFFWCNSVLGVPAQVGKAAWCALVLVLAVVGAARLIRTQCEMREGSGSSETPVAPWTPWVGAVLFACSPVLVATTQSSPSDGLVAALLPWLIGPMVRGERGWRAAARSAAWLGLAGIGSPAWAFSALIAGAAAAVVAARRPGGVRQLVRWVLLGAASSAWWIAAFVWESAYATDVAALVVTGEPTADVISDALGLGTNTTGWLILATIGPLLVAVAALLQRTGPDRALVGSLLALAVVAAVLWVQADGLPGWVPVSATALTATDSMPVPWMPLLAWVALAGLLSWYPLVEHVLDRLPGAGAWPWAPEQGLVVAATVLLVLASAAGPVLAAQERPAPDGDSTDDAQWAAVAAWSTSAPPGRVLVLPAVAGARFDAVLTDALRGRPWVARDMIPRSGPAATAALDDALWRLSRGHAGAGTAAALRHLGISYVLLRNDVEADFEKERPVALVRHALAGQGAARVAVIEAKPSSSETADVVDLGVRDPTGSLEVWALESSADGAVYSESTLTVAGEPGVIGDLADAGLVPTGAVRLAALGSGTVDLVSDSARRRDLDQRAALDPFGPTLGSEESRTLVPPDAAPEPTAFRRLDGAEGIRASSSAADLGSAQRRTGADPYAAVDGNGFTAWLSKRGAVVDEWWEITFDRSTDLTEASLLVVQNAFAAHSVTEVRLESDGGTTDVTVATDGVVDLAPAGMTKRLRVSATRIQGMPSPSSSFGIAEVKVPRLEVEDRLVVNGSDTSTWLLASRPGSFATCVPAYPTGGADDPGATEVVCNGGVSVDGPDAGSLSRVLLSDESATVAGRVWMRAADGAAPSRLADRLAEPTITVTGSSTASADVVTRPQAAADEDAETAWRPSSEDEAPTLELTWPRGDEVSGVRVLLVNGKLASRPTQVVVRYGDSPDDTVTKQLGTDGLVEIPPVRTNSLSLTFESEDPVRSVDSMTGGLRQMPVAVSEIEVLGGPGVEYDADEVDRLPCGSGPVVSVGGEEFESAVTASARQIVDSSVVTATLCGRPDIASGEVPVDVEASFSWIPLGLALAPPDGPLGPVDQTSPEEEAFAPVPAGVIDDGHTTRPIEVEIDAEGSGPSTLVLAVPTGKGWTAVVDGRELPELTVDGWAQGWQVPGGTTGVTLRYASGDLLRLGAGGAALGWVAVLLLALGSRPRTRRPSSLRTPVRRDQAIVGTSTHA